MDGWWFGSEEKVDTNNQAGRKKRWLRRAWRFIIIQDLSSNVLLGIQDAAGANGTAGEWSFPSRTTALAQFPGNLVLVLSASVLLVGPKRRRCCTAFFLLISTGAIFRACNVLYRSYCLRHLCKWQRDAEARGQRERRQSLIPWPALVIHDIHLPCGNRGAVALIPLVSRSPRLGWLEACMRWKLLRLRPVSHQAHELAWEMHRRPTCTKTQIRCRWQRGRTRGRTPAGGLSQDTRWARLQSGDTQPRLTIRLR